MNYRAEIISNQSVQDDVIEVIEQEIPNVQYSILSDVMGKGTNTRKLGDATWPEMNFLLFVYTDLQGAKKIKKIVEVLKQKFPNEGISVFFTKSEEI